MSCSFSPSNLTVPGFWFAMYKNKLSQTKLSTSKWLVVRLFGEGENMRLTNQQSLVSQAPLSTNNHRIGTLEYLTIVQKYVLIPEKVLAVQKALKKASTEIMGSLQREFSIAFGLQQKNKKRE